MTKEEYMHIYNLVGTAMEVYNNLQRGLAEELYQEAMEIELEMRKIPFEREKKLQVYYKGRPMKKYYEADFYSNGVIVEFKSASCIISEFRAQLFNYMRISKTRFGLLINFGEPSLKCERYLYLPNTDDFVLINQDNYKDYID